MRFVRTALMIAVAGPACDMRFTGPREQRSPAEPTVLPASPAPAARTTRRPVRPRASRPLNSIDRDQPQVAALVDVPAKALCVTSGELVDGRVDVPTFRAVAPANDGDAAAIRVVVHGETATSRALASGQHRRQLGLKLRAQDGCNLVYAMWRLDPKPKLEVSLKHNPGARTTKECGARGYTKVKPARTASLPALDDGAAHELRAEIAGDTLTAWIDDRVVWQGRLPASARNLAGPAGVRSDNLAFDLTGLAVDRRAGGEVEVKCRDDIAAE